MFHILFKTLIPLIFAVNFVYSYKYAYKYLSNPYFANPKDRSPQQIHLSLASELNAMTVSWVTMSHTSSTVRYSRNKHNLYHKATGFASHFTDTRGVKRFTHTVKMKPLRTNRRYYYKVGSSSNGWSKIYSFKTLAYYTRFPLNICIVGDLGISNGVSIDDIKKSVRRKEIDLIIHIGDIAYDFHTYGNYGNRGDNFMKKMESVIAEIPYMIIAGNHEDDGRNFTHLRYRFNMPDDPDRANQYYSFDYGPIHFVGVSSEYLAFYRKYGQEAPEAQYNWLKNDFNKANNNRMKVPWIIVYQHRPIYCSIYCNHEITNTMRYGKPGIKPLEPLYIQQKVDFVIAGHIHYYDRFLPMANGQAVPSRGPNPYHQAKAPIYVISGTGGCYSNLSYRQSFKAAIGSVVR